MQRFRLADGSALDLPDDAELVNVGKNGERVFEVLWPKPAPWIVSMKFDPPTSVERKAYEHFFQRAFRREVDSVARRLAGVDPNFKL